MRETQTETLSRKRGRERGRARGREIQRKRRERVCLGPLCAWGRERDSQGYTDKRERESARERERGRETESSVRAFADAVKQWVDSTEAGDGYTLPKTSALRATLLAALRAALRAVCVCVCVL